MTDQYENDPYAGNEGLRQLIEDAADRAADFIGAKTEVMRKVNRAAAVYIEEIKLVERAKTCVEQWEKHALGVLQKSVPLEPQLTSDNDAKLTQIANDIHSAKHPLLKRIA
jgi:hypothetical protein